VVETVTVEQLTARVRELASGPRRLLGITGAPGAGKSTLAEALAATVGDRAVYVPMDGFHLADEVLDRRGSHSRKGAIDTFDGAGYANLLRRLRDQCPDEVVFAPRFDRGLEAAIAGAIEIGPTTPLVITEGNYLLQPDGAWPAARACLDEVWFLDLDERTRHRRLIDRHVDFGRTPEQARAHALGSDETNARRIIAGADAADRLFRLVG
jgi:pantothenate kinase